LQATQKIINYLEKLDAEPEPEPEEEEESALDFSFDVSFSLNGTLILDPCTVSLNFYTGTATNKYR
jgi:hypothetical protein